MDSIFDQLNVIFRDASGDQTLFVTNETKLNQIEGLDSFAMLSVILQVEEIYGVTVDVEALFKRLEVRYFTELIEQNRSKSE